MLSPSGGWEGDEKKKNSPDLNVNASARIMADRKNSSLSPIFLGQVLFCIFLSVISLLSDTALVNHFQWGDKDRMSHPKETHLQKLWVWWKVFGGKMWSQCTCRNKIFFLKNGLGRKDAKMNSPRRGISADHSGAYSSGNRYISLPVRRPRCHVHSRHPNIPSMLLVQLHDDFIKPPNWQTVSAPQLLSSRLHSP